MGTPPLPSPRSFHRLAALDNILILVGGFDGVKKNDGFAISIQLQNFENSLELQNLEEENQMIYLPQEQQDQINSNNFLNQIPQESEIDIQTEIQDEEDQDQVAIDSYKEQLKILSTKLQKEEEKNLCKVCYQREIDSVLLECCHSVLCYGCSQNIIHCPICRSEITRVVKTYSH
eukprot:TRINITY_DN43049_c0_g1_i1.p1 TRINITY_DN43049_c0_g1~~TRINITY_DN43049_c0_g1_i1.p1  ORF type:complete len:175 (-),score=30.34 TRINITY_DN43049_c0_g1_i1:72-596(-)